MTTTGTWYPPVILSNPPFKMTPETPNRDEQHGGMEAVGRVAQQMKDALRLGRNWHQLSPGEREALDMICHKIGRVLSGSNPHDQQHWEDLAGYPVAAMRGMETTP